MFHGASRPRMWYNAVNMIGPEIVAENLELRHERRRAQFTLALVVVDTLLIVAALVLLIVRN